jgi:hypothetical protein
MKVLELDEMLGTNILFCPNFFNHHGTQISKGYSLVSVLNSTKKVSFCFAKRSCKEDQLLAIGVQPNCHNFQI